MIPTFTLLLAPLAAPAPDLQIVLYDVAALTGRDRLDSLVAAMETTNAEGGRAALDRYETLRADVDRRATELATSIRELARPPFDEDLHAVSVLDGGRLAFVGSTEQHAWVRSVLDEMRGFTGFVEVEGRILQLPRGLMTELGIDGASGSFLSDADVERLLRALMERGDVDLITMPRVTFTPLQSALLTVYDEIPYIADFERTEVSGETVLDPVIRTVQEGLLLELRAVPLADGRIALSSRLEHSKVHRPIPTFSTTFDGELGEPVTVQLPEVQKLRVEGRFDLWPTQHPLLVAPDEAGETETAVLLRCTRVDETGAEIDASNPSENPLHRRVTGELGQIHAALFRFAVRNANRWPDDLEWLVLEDENGAAYLSPPEAIVDPWGRTYLFELLEPDRPVVSTLGADGTPGGTGEDADISFGGRERQ